MDVDESCNYIHPIQLTEGFNIHNDLLEYINSLYVYICSIVTDDHNECEYVKDAVCTIPTLQLRTNCCKDLNEIDFQFIYQIVIDMLNHTRERGIAQYIKYVIRESIHDLYNDRLEIKLNH